MKVTDPRFFPLIYGLCASRLGHKSMEKKLSPYLQYGLQTLLVRGIDSFVKYTLNEGKGSVGSPRVGVSVFNYSHWLATN